MKPFNDICDVHVHVGPYPMYAFAETTAECLVQEMDRRGVATALVSHTSALQSPSRGNVDTCEAVRRFPGRFKGLAVITPQYAELTRRILDDWDALGPDFVGFKFHPVNHNYALSRRRYDLPLGFADDRGLIVLVHTWGKGHVQDRPEWRRTIQDLVSPAQFRGVAERYSHVRFIAGHAFNGDWSDAVDLVREFPNVYLDISTVDDRGGIEFLCERAGADRILFGSDYPFVGLRYAIGTVLAADITDEDKKRILSTNARRLLAGKADDVESGSFGEGVTQ